MLGLRQDSFDAIELFLDSLPRKTVMRGREYFLRGAVQKLECVAAGQRYRAVVRGSKSYKVTLEFEDGDWDAECSCPMMFDCKHGVAAILELQNRALPGVNPSMEASIKIIEFPRARIAESARERGQRVKNNASPAKRPRGVRQPPSSPLYNKLVEHLARELTSEEADFIRRVQAAYNNAGFRSFTEADLGSLAADALPASSFNYWQQVDLYPHYPGDDFLFWLHVARELRRRNVRWPEFMDGISDFSVIEPVMREWELEKEIAQWTKWFQEFRVAPVSDPGTLELRLMVLADEARLQWRTVSNAPFADLKPAQAKRFAEQFDQGALSISSESLPLWSATYKPWHYENWWSFKYASATVRPRLSQLLRMPLTPDRVVTGDGQPLARVAGSLRLDLRPPYDGNHYYELALVMADGSPPPRILCALDGQPTLYLTERGLFPGPPASVLERELRKAIPTAALETANGVRFLKETGVPLPEHLRECIRTVPIRVTIACALKPVYPGSPSEELVVTVSAKAPGMAKQRFTSRGWEAASNFESNKEFKPQAGVITVHDHSAQKHFPRVLEPLGLKWDNYPGEWRLRLTRKTPDVFLQWLQSLPPEIEVLLDKQLATLRDEPVSGTVSLDVAEAGIDWFDLKVALQISDATLTPEELKLLLNARGGYVRLGKKGWRRLKFNLTPEEDEQLARLGLTAKDFSAEPQRFHALQLADDAAKRFLPPERVEKIQRRVSELKTRVTPPLPSAIRAELRPYQTEGFHFLAYLTANRFGGVLADDMGLGKTLQTLAWLAWLRNGTGGATETREQSALEASSAGMANSAQSNGVGKSEFDRGEARAPLPSLVVCPKSVTDNWRTEAERFYPDLRVRVWRGEPAEELPEARGTAHLIVINYAQLRSLSPEIADVPWRAAILDEAQYIKNPDSQTAQAARALKAEHRLALTGTPIENRLLDLWSILGFAMPGALGHRAHFLRRFDAKDDPLARRRLAARVRPFLLRRTKSQVARDLPDRVEEDLLCEMEGEQKTLYRAELKRARQIILGLKTNQQLNQERFNILTSLLRLRQICCHPALVDGKLRDAESAKVAALEDLLEPLMEEGHKVLVFSQFVTMLDLLRDKVMSRDWPYFYLAGETENRGELVQKFQSAKGGAAFLISLKAGGFGLNLTAASYVVLFDPWWNPAVENQAIDRTHRIGQTSKVMAYRLLIRESIEEKIRALQKQKAALASDVLGEERFAQSLTLDDLRFLFAE